MKKIPEMPVLPSLAERFEELRRKDRFEVKFTDGETRLWTREGLALYQAVHGDFEIAKITHPNGAVTVFCHPKGQHQC